MAAGAGDKRLTVIDHDDAMSILGEAIHTSLRKGSDDPYANEAWRSIDGMSDEGWCDVLSFLLDGLEASGVILAQEARDA